MKAFETTGTVDEHCQLTLDRPLSNVTPGRVRIIILKSEEDDLSESEWVESAVNNSAFDFLKDEAQDIYTLSDGKPFTDEG